MRVVSPAGWVDFNKQDSLSPVLTVILSAVKMIVLNPGKLVCTIRPANKDQLGPNKCC